MGPVKVGFEGFVQVRLATDPDPCDEPRGVSGWTHAVAGEPNLDRVLVLQADDPRCVHRSHGPHVGVTVTSVVTEGAESPDHPLLGARIELQGAPRFEGRNWVVENDGREPIDPLHISITKDALRLEKQDQIEDATGTPIPLYQATPEQLERRIPAMEGGPAVSREVFRALGITDGDPVAWRSRRRTALENDLEDLPASGVEATALSRRIEDLTLTGVAVDTVGVRMRFGLAMNGPGSATDDQGVLPGVVDVAADWPLEFWVGGWDADALCMFMRGSVTVPFDSTAQRRGRP